MITDVIGRLLQLTDGAYACALASVNPLRQNKAGGIRQAGTGRYEKTQSDKWYGRLAPEFSEAPHLNEELQSSPKN